jgi:hypothetical protein
MEGVHFKFLVVDSRIILNGTSTFGMGERTYKRDSWRALVNAVMKLLVPKYLENFSNS